jgi:2-phosphosulfolactate phosphatase
MAQVSTSQPQSQYQVRFDWGSAGVRALGPNTDIVVWVDVLDAGEPRSWRTGAAPGAQAVAASLRNRTAVAEWISRQQKLKGDRVSVAVIAAGDAREDGSFRFSVEDLLAAGAVIDALAVEGHDYSSPEAAAACAAFTGLRGAVGHLISASTTGKALAARGDSRQLEDAAAIDASSEVRLLGE